MVIIMGKKMDVHKTIAIFLIIIGILPFLGVSFGMLTRIINVLVIVSGIVILLTK